MRSIQSLKVAKKKLLERIEFKDLLEQKKIRERANEIDAEIAFMMRQPAESGGVSLPQTIDLFGMPTESPAEITRIQKPFKAEDIDEEFKEEAERFVGRMGSGSTPRQQTFSEKQQQQKNRWTKLSKKRRLLASKAKDMDKEERLELIKRIEAIEKEMAEMGLPLTKSKQEKVELVGEAVENKIGKNLPDDVKNLIGDYLRGAGRPSKTATELVESAFDRQVMKQIYKQDEKMRKEEAREAKKQTTVSDTLSSIGYNMPQPDNEADTVDSPSDRNEDITEMETQDEPTKPVASSSREDYPQMNNSSDMYNIVDKPLTDTGMEGERTYNDDLVLTSYENMKAYDNDMYSGLTPQEVGHTEEKQEYFSNELIAEQDEINEAVLETIKDIEILSGLEKDSIFNATDLHSARFGGVEHDDLNPAINESGYERWQNRHHIPNVDVSRVQEHFAPFAGRIGNPLVNSEHFQGVYRQIYGRDNPITSSGDDILSNITNNLEVNDSEGWYSRDNNSLATQPISINERFSDLNMRPLSNEFERGVYDPTVSNKYYRNVLAGNQMGGGSTAPMAGMPPLGEQSELPQMAGGVAPRGLGEIRKPDTSYKTPNRKIRDKGINLVRQSNKTALELANELNY